MPPAARNLFNRLSRLAGFLLKELLFVRAVLSLRPTTSNFEAAFSAVEWAHTDGRSYPASCQYREGQHQCEKVGYPNPIHRLSEQHPDIDRIAVEFF